MTKPTSWNLEDFASSFKYDIDYSTTDNYNCEEYGCREDGICRCRKIESVSINNINLPDITKLILGKLNVGDKEALRSNTIQSILLGFDVNEYCIHRAITALKFWHTDLWEASFSGNYYGEEVDSICLDYGVAGKFLQILEEILDANTIEDKVNIVLNLEFGSIHEKLQGKKYTIKEINLTDLYFGNKEHHKKAKKKNAYYARNNYIENQILGVVCFDGQVDKYRVIDGYHRLSACDASTVKVIVAE